MAVPSVRDIKYRLPAFPRQVRFESASKCAFTCPWCHGHGVKKMTRPKGFMSLELLENCLDEIASWPQPLSEVVPTNFGELFMHPKWFEFATLISERLPSTAMVLPTTGIMLNEKSLQKLSEVRTLRVVNFSVNAYFGETFSRIHGVPERFLDKVKENIRTFKRLRPDVHIRVSMVYDPRVTSELERELFIKEWLGAVDQVEVNHASFADNPMMPPPDPPVTIPCRSVFDGLVVFSDGRVGTGCCFDADAELEVGRVPEERLIDIWRGEKLKRIVDLHLGGRRAELELCRRCTFA